MKEEVDHENTPRRAAVSLSACVITRWRFSCFLGPPLACVFAKTCSQTLTCVLVIGSHVTSTTKTHPFEQVLALSSEGHFAWMWL